MGWLKKNISTIVIVLVGLVGLGLLVYPTFSDWWNSMHQSYAIASYDQAVAELDPHEHDAIFEAAEAYNAQLTRTGFALTMSEEQMKIYNKLLDVTGSGMMGYVDIPKIDVSLPIYHGTNDAVLQVAVGHIAGSSLPVGGIGTHACMSGHRGLPSARLFSDLDMLIPGDLFMITVLDRIFTYEVDQVRIVLPTELNDLAIDPEHDYVTLITCTPYGVNSHRLLVRGHRVDNPEGSIVVLADAVQIEPRTIALYLAIPVLLSILFWLLLLTGRRSRYRKVKAAATEQFQERAQRRREKAMTDVEGDDSSTHHEGK